jgi:3-oxoadipate enol-lactonase
MQFTLINGHHIHYEHIDNQRDKTFVFINSLGTDFRIWDEVTKGLKSHGNTLRFDKAGHGLSELPPADATIQHYAHDVVELMNYLQIQKAILVGLSIGGIIAQHVAIHYPQRVERLVLSNTAPKVGTEESWNTRINIVKTKGIEAIADAVMKAWFSENFRQNQPEKLAGCKTMLINSNPNGYVSACEALKFNDLTSKIQAINCPTLCLAGTEDGSTPPPQVKALADGIPNAQYVLIEGVGHIPCVEVPEKVAQLIGDFVGL